VLADHLKLLALLWARPTAAMGAILDRGSALFALAVALAASFALRTAAGLPFGFFMPVVILALVYVPGVLLLSALIGRLGSVGMVFQRDYSPLLTCAAMIWTAAALVFSVGALALPPEALAWLGAAACFYFAALIALAARTLFGISTGAAIAVAALSWAPLAAVVFLWAPLQMIMGWLASPFFLFYAWYFLGGELRGLGGGLRTRQAFRRSLEAAAVNPHDGDAQYQLGLIHQQRRQYTEAVRRFRNAVAIDPEETDAHFQLGRIAREQGRNDEALQEFETVLRQDEKHGSSEIRRELGAVYLAGNRFEDARRELDVYAERRPYDPEGLYYYGRVMEALGNAPAARELYERAVEAARTAPRYRRRITAPWSRLAQKEARRLARS
jgi:tetratricopeptide (TPR) repeat protein